MWRVRIFFGKRQICAFWLCVAGTCGSTMPISERHRAMKEDSIDVVNGRRLPEIGLMHKKISPCKGVYIPLQQGLSAVQCGFARHARPLKAIINYPTVDTVWTL
ncbi:TPA: hypothetical protein GE363_07050 [Escherichia coli]|nr:hypothetical protein CA593_16840 [Escherichia coli]OYI13838.1 hypothetical protein CI724_11870 [Shigella sonnei]ASB79799.1 hypothetical protein AM384_15455 [Escherichia coli]EFB3777052.1 hypothetical protein [Escherichia coli]KQJ25109.1 hypothetical protein AM268_07695 [Escherichia coli]